MDELTEYLTNSADDGFWEQIQTEARHVAEREPVLVSFLFASVLGHKKLEDGLSVILGNKLHTPDLPAMLLRDLISEALPKIVRSGRRSELTCWPRGPGIPRRVVTRSRFFITRGSMRSRPIGSLTGCGGSSVSDWRPTYKIASPKPWRRYPSRGPDWLWRVNRSRHKRRHR